MHFEKINVTLYQREYSDSLITTIEQRNIFSNLVSNDLAS